ncbi:uncharacterized protein DUF4435 [Pontibacter ummariensis]|uniref:DUF4435 domain-containing protein n=1 Tax=Pontibacter ummariensis TaxID=1610492 RepID=A0A239J491_9BACT|nr:DUF4435 domain-containing protein [Pontibacter ummariensis]PRY08860.1 uncharacterized protein DUF4435 [Pontibacter ummariensis]SNT00288.1 Protein of unknown function [Pontibacter ummariensis]
MDIIEEAKRELNSGLVAYTEFVLDYKKNSDSIYCFYEGKEDRSYYSFRVKMIHPETKYFDYVCNGKENTFKLYSLIQNHSEYSSSKVAYFVDRDFDPIASEQDIYTTPYYSVENFYVVDEAFKSILTNEFNISRQCSCYQMCIDLFKSCKELFHEKILLLNAWLACQTDLRLEEKLNTRLSIDKTLKNVIDSEEFDKVVMPDLKTLVFPNRLTNVSEIESIFHDAPKVPSERLSAKVAELSGMKADEVFRGKFELRFLVSFLNRLKDELGKRKDSMFPKRYSCSLRFEYATSVSQLTNNAVTPACLLAYVRKIGYEE